MQNVLLSLAVLACPLGMGAMMWFMARGMGGKRDQSATPPSLEALREEHRRLGGEIERLEHDRAPSGTHP
jgi:hypothetical protein